MLYGTERTSHIPASISAIASGALENLRGFKIIYCDRKEPASIGSNIINKGQDIYFVVPNVTAYRSAWSG